MAASGRALEGLRAIVLTNPWLVLGVSIQGLAQLAITYLPAMNSVFGTAPLGAGAWLRIAAIAVGVAVVVEAEKALRRRAAALA